MQRWLPPAGRQVFGVPLALKMAGANAIVLATTIGLAVAHGGLGRSDIPLLAAALALSFLLSTVVVVLALEPVRALERAGRRILSGELGARVEVSVLADRDVRRMASVMNSLLEALTSERERIRDLAVRVVSAHDDERARVARELEDSTAQGLAALLYELRGEVDRAPDAASRARLERLLGMASSNLEELRSITSVVHPRVLTDLGLTAALQWLARSVGKRHDIAAAVRAPVPMPHLRPMIAAALFAVARDAAERAAERAGVTALAISVNISGHCAQLVVEDDGAALSPVQTSELESVLRQRVGLVDGWVSVEKPARGGSAIIAAVPMSL